jgi:RecA-family ATPase
MRFDVEGGGYAFPQRTLDYLDHGATEGNRNDALFDAAGQFRDARKSLQEASDALIPRGTADGLSRTECVRTIKSAYNHSPREPIGNGRDGVDLRWHGDSRAQAQPPVYRRIHVEPEPLPPALDEGGKAAITYLETFEPEAFVAIGYRYEKIDEEGKIALPITQGQVRTVESWIADIKVRGMDQVFPYVDGVFVRVNPMKDADGKADKDVACRKDILVEADEGSLEEQLAAIKKIGLPIRAMVCSGDRSVNAIVTIDAPDEDSYRERYQVVREFCEQSLGLKLDPKNKNPSRYTRLPGVKRILRDHRTNEKLLYPDDSPIVVEQTLLAVNLPGKPWDDWVKCLPIETPEDPEKEFIDALAQKYEAALHTSEQLETLEIPKRRFLLGNWMREGDLGFVFGERGAGKTFLVDALVTYLSAGKALAEWAVPEPVSVLLVDGEMPLDAHRDRIKGMQPGNPLLHVLHHESLFDMTGLAMNLTDPRQQKAITALCVKLSKKLLVLDNLSCLFSGMKENDADAWELVLNWLLDLRRRKIAVLIVHHASRSGTMRGTSKREDAAFWIIRVEEAKNRPEEETGAKFQTIFEKQRNSPLREWTMEWTFQTEADGQVSIGCVEIAFSGKVLQLIQDGLHSATDIADELKSTKGTISKTAQKLKNQNLIEIDGRGQYRPRGFMKKT